MSELCFSSNACAQFFSLVISDFSLFCYFIFSHPLYLSYFIFFSPYILKLLSFISPLFLTTSLLLLALLFHEKFKSFPQSDKPSLLLSTYHAVLEIFKSQPDAKIETFCPLEDFEVYKFVFEETPIEFLDYTSAQVLEKPLLENSVDQGKDNVTCTDDLENSGEMEKKLEEFLKEMDEFESKTWSNSAERKKIEAFDTNTDKGVGKLKEEIITGNGSKEDVTVDKVKKAHSWRLVENLDYNNSNDGLVCNYNNDNNNLGSYGSMRKEKEWTRTLACKLYEERHNAAASDDGSGEGMDLLWETYELDSTKGKVKRDNNSSKKKKMKKKGELKSYKKDQEEEEDDGEDLNGQLCCLQALKFSAGKMNLGMGRPNLVKFSKAIRGFGWLHHVSKKNKVHCGDRF